MLSASRRSTSTASPTAPPWARSTRPCTRTASVASCSTATLTPRDVWYQANLNQDIAFDRNMGIYFVWVAKHDSVYHLGNDGANVERTYYWVLKQLRSHPQAGGLVGPEEWTDAFLGAGYYVYGWEDVRAAFDAAVNQGDFAAIKDLYDSSNGQGPGADNGYAVDGAVQCTDVRWPQRWALWQRDNWRIYVSAPFETWSNAWYNAPCLHWAGQPGTPVNVDGRKAPGILLIDETNDAATPYPGLRTWCSIVTALCRSPDNQARGRWSR